MTQIEPDPVRDARPVWTTAVTTPFGTALDPSVAEVSWLGWELRAADPTRVDEAVHRIVTGGFARLVETAWDPGRAVVITEIEAVPGPLGVRLVSRLLLGCGGATGTTRSEVEGLRSVVERLIDRPDGPYSVARIDAREVLGPREGDRIEHHAALIRQRTVTVDGVGGEDGVEVVSRFNPTMGPWGAAAERLADLAGAGTPVRVRATALCTQLDPYDRAELRRRIGSAARLAHVPEADAETVFNAERAHATLLDHQASLASPILVGEIAVSSPHRLADSFLRSIAAAFTSEVEVLRQQGRTVVAGQRLILGGYELERDPDGLAGAQAIGLPLRGGLTPRTLRDLVTLTECPIGWPIPVGRGLPGVATSPTELAVPATLQADPRDPGAFDVVGTTGAGLPVGLSHERRVRHVIVTGNWGSGKSTVASHLVHADLEAGRPFLLVDPHGPLAEHVQGWAGSLGVETLVLDPGDSGTGCFAPFDRLRPDGSNLGAVERQIARWLDAVAASLPNPEFASVRWFSMAQSWALVQAAHGASFEEAVVWLNDGDELLARLGHPLVTPLARSTLRTVVGPTASRDAADLRTWVSSKFHALVSGPARRILAAPGAAPTIGASIAGRRPIIANLGALSTGEAFLVGHLVVDAGVDGVMARPADQRNLYGCYVDEAHRFPTPALRRGLAEGRKYGLSLLLIAQAYGQWDAELADLAMSAGTQILFRATPDTARRAGASLGLDPDALLRLRDLHAVVAANGTDPVEVTVPPYAAVPVPVPTVPSCQGAGAGSVGGAPDRAAARPGPATDHRSPANRRMQRADQIQQRAIQLSVLGRAAASAAT